MYYGKDCENANDGDEIMVYLQIVSRDSNGVWFADGTDIGEATVGDYFGGGNAGTGMVFANQSIFFQIKAMRRAILPEHGCPQRTMLNIIGRTHTQNRRGVAMPDTDIVEHSTGTDNLQIKRNIRVFSNGKSFIANLRAVQNQKLPERSIRIKKFYNCKRINNRGHKQTFRYKAIL